MYEETCSSSADSESKSGQPRVLLLMCTENHHIVLLTAAKWHNAKGALCCVAVALLWNSNEAGEIGRRRLAITSFVLAEPWVGLR